MINCLTDLLMMIAGSGLLVAMVWGAEGCTKIEGTRFVQNHTLNQIDTALSILMAS